MELVGWSSLMPSGTSGLYAMNGTKMTFAHSIDRMAYHAYQLRGPSGLAYDGTCTCYGVTCYPTASTTGNYYAWIRNYSSDPFTVTGVTISF